MLPVERLDLTHHVNYAKHGKPVPLPNLGRKAVRSNDEVQVAEGGKSKGRPVMGRIGIEPFGNIIPCESKQTSAWSFNTRNRCELLKKKGGSMKTEVVKIDAVSSGKLEISWHRINWYKAHQHVRMMQLRIAKATREGKTRKIKSLQRLLPHSFHAKALAVQRVTENQGKATPGVDGQTWSTPNAKFQALSSLKKKGYKPLSLRYYCWWAPSPREYCGKETILFSPTIKFKHGFCLTLGHEI